MANVFNANELRNGNVYIDGGSVYRVLKYEHKKYGRGQATIKVKVRDINSGAISDKSYDTGAKLEEADTAKRSSQYLYQDEKNLYFMDLDDYSQFSLPISDLEDEQGFLKEGEKVITLYLDSNPISIELPKTVELEVTEATEAVSGDTVNNALKSVKLETGLDILVPMFVKTGDVLKINTERKEYINRVT